MLTANTVGPVNVAGSIPCEPNVKNQAKIINRKNNTPFATRYKRIAHILCEFILRFLAAKTANMLDRIT
ncbi:hypothetical protein ACJBSP_11745, partial [Streptococcus suis]